MPSVADLCSTRTLNCWVRVVTSRCTQSRAGSTITSSLATAPCTWQLATCTPHMGNNANITCVLTSVAVTRLTASTCPALVATKPSWMKSLVSHHSRQLGSPYCWARSWSGPGLNTGVITCTLYTVHLYLYTRLTTSLLQLSPEPATRANTATEDLHLLSFYIIKSIEYCSICC